MSDFSRSNEKLLTRPQWKCILSSAETFWAFEVLHSDTGEWSAAGLSGLLGLNKSALQEALNALHKLKLLSKNKAGRFHCPFRNQGLRAPSEKILSSNSNDTVKKWIQKLSGKRNKPHSNFIFLRTSKASLEQYYPNIIHALRGAMVCGSNKKEDDSGFFMVELLLHDVLPF